MPPRREVTFDGCTYKVRSTKAEIPDLDALTRFEALGWLVRNTYPRGYSRPASPLAGFGDAISINQPEGGQP